MMFSDVKPSFLTETNGYTVNRSSNVWKRQPTSILPIDLKHNLTDLSLGQSAITGTTRVAMISSQNVMPVDSRKTKEAVLKKSVSPQTPEGFFEPQRTLNMSWNGAGRGN